MNSWTHFFDIDASVPKIVKEGPHQVRIYQLGLSCGDENCWKTGFCAEMGTQEPVTIQKGSAASHLQDAALPI